jgi:hypothetical protein
MIEQSLSLSESYALPTHLLGIILGSASRLLSNATVSRNGEIEETSVESNAIEKIELEKHATVVPSRHGSPP